MTYQLQDDRGSPVGGDSFESFWLYLSFRVTKQTGILQLQQRCYFAFYTTGTSGYRNIAMPQFGEDPSSVQVKDYKLVDTAGQRTLQLNSLSLVESRTTEFSNEYSQLSVFRFVGKQGDGNTGAPPDSWINDGAWGSDGHQPRDRNERPEDPFIPHLLSFDNCKERDCFWVMSRENQKGLQRLAAVVPFDQGSVSSNLLQNVGKKMPELELKVNDNPWKGFAEDKHPDETVGFSMICSGAFREMELGREIEEWRSLPGGGSEVTDYLTGYIERRARFQRGPKRKLERCLQNIEMSDDDTSVDTDSRDPVEVIHFDFGQLHKVQPLDMFM
jgi:hypothetical protein